MPTICMDYGEYRWLSSLTELDLAVSHHDDEGDVQWLCYETKLENSFACYAMTYDGELGTLQRLIRHLWPSGRYYADNGILARMRYF